MNMEYKLSQKIVSAIKSILYDIDKKLQDIKNIMQVEKKSLVENTEILQADFPISTVQLFNAFDDSLKDQEKQKALVNNTAVYYNHLFEMFLYLTHIFIFIYV